MNILGLTSEDVENSILASRKKQQRYASEALLKSLQAMETYDASTPVRTLATDIFGSTSTLAPLTPERCTESPLFTKNTWNTISDAVNDISKQVLNPHWRLSSVGLQVLGDTVELTTTPLLNAFNAFEWMMQCAILAAANNNESNYHQHPSAVLDRELVRTTYSDFGRLVSARLDRIVSLFCYTLVSVVAWKRDIYDKSNGVETPVRVRPDDDLEVEILERIDRFVLPGCGSAIAHKYAASSIKRTAIAITATGAETAAPAFEGAFYDTVLGNQVMGKLIPLLSDEYAFLLKKVENLVAAAPVDATRRASLSESERRAEDAVPKAVNIGPHKMMSGELDTRGVEAFHREVKRQMKDDPNLTVEKAVDAIFSTRQLLFSNFAITGAYSTAVYYCLWNFMFLAAGTATVPRVPERRVCRRLLTDLILLDFHSLLLCPKCSIGIIHKATESFDFVDALKYGTEEQVERKMTRAFGYYNEGPTSVQDCFKTLLGLKWSPPHTSHEGNRQLVEFDNKLIQLSLDNNNVDYTKKQIDMAQKAVGYAFFGIYALLASALYTADDDKFIDSTATKCVLNNTPRGGGDPIGAAPRSKDNDLLCVAGVWALRNAVRMRKSVIGLQNPGFPLPLINVLNGNEDWLDRILNHPALDAPTDSVVTDVFAQFDKYMDARRGNTSLGAALRMLNDDDDAAAAHKPAVERNVNDTHPFAMRGDMVWSASRVQTMSRDDLSALAAFPMTEYDT
ncbi:uncharacterized protein LOC143022764 [Oratosquilla oratoria]|uniref:uncharacterized protein LOC143022764 n=1 Tax=Oratosquilla oratoria TaxID=337810 RepID=UPI003F75B8BB